MTWRFAAAAAVAIGLVAAPSPAGAETPGTVTQYPLPAGSAPRAVASAQGDLWVTLPGANAIARVTTAGGVTLIPLPTANAGPQEIVLGPDGNLWFTERTASRVGRLATDGKITEFPTPTANAQPDAITTDAVGNMWITETGRVARLTTAGVITEFTVPGGEARDIVLGPDNNLWYTAPVTNQIGRVDPTTGAATEFFAPGNPTSMSIADSTTLWYTQQTGAAIRRIDTTGTLLAPTPLPTSTAADAILRVADGTSWFTEGNGLIGNVTPAAQITDFPLPTQLAPLGIAEGPDAAIWVPVESTAQLARVGTAASSAAIAPPVTGSTIGATTISGTVRVRLPGSRQFVPLGDGRALPVGTVVDARSGTIQLSATSGTVAYTGQFFEGQFQLAQRKRKGATADLKLFGGNFRGCPRGARPAANKKKSVRHLWGDGGGKFRTVGRFSSAAVRGTKWLTDDQCGGTLTRVVSGSVAVRDFVRRKNVVVRAGKRYLARPAG